MKQGESKILFFCHHCKRTLLLERRKQIRQHLAVCKGI
jgi:hypothetical protein